MAERFGTGRKRGDGAWVEVGGRCLQSAFPSVKAIEIPQLPVEKSTRAAKNTTRFRGHYHSVSDIARWNGSGRADSPPLNLTASVLAHPGASAILIVLLVLCRWATSKG